MYGKLFAQMYDGSLYGKWQALVTFQQLVILADPEGVVDMTPQAIAARTSIPLEIITTGLAELEQPDPNSRTPDEEGRRILRLSEHRSWGWRITNYVLYRRIRSAEERRDYHRIYQSTRRAAPVNPVNTVSTGVNSSEQSQPIVEAEAEAEGEVKKTSPYSEDFEALWRVYPKRPNNSKAEAWRAYNARLHAGETHDAMLAGVIAYAAYVQRERTQPKYVKHAATFLGPDRHYLNDFGSENDTASAGRDSDLSDEPGLVFLDELLTPPDSRNGTVPESADEATHHV